MSDFSAVKEPKRQFYLDFPYIELWSLPMTDLYLSLRSFLSATGNTNHNLKLM